MSELNPSSQPRVSAVISVLNPDPVYFREAVASVLDQTVGDLELIIIEEPSERRAADTLREFDDPRIRHFLHPERTSLVAQRNRGLEMARSDIVALLDADDICVPDRYEKQLAFLETHPAVAVLGSQLEIMGPDGKHLGYRSYPCTHEALVRALARYNAIAQPAVMYRKSAVLEAGGYQYARHKFTEDYELWSRMARRGYQLANHPEPLIRYRVHPSGSKTSSLRSILLGTIEIKEMHWADVSDPDARARRWLERLLLYAPPKLVLKLFLALQTSKRYPGMTR